MPARVGIHLGKFLRLLLHRKSWVIFFGLTLLLGFVWLLLGTFSISASENLPDRIEFPTNSRYTEEINSFFNRTEVTPQEDPVNKLAEDYTVRGYAVMPRAAKPAAGYPVVIWMHGFAVSAEMQMNYPRQFAKSGFLAIAISQPGHGSSGGLWDMGIQALAGAYSAVDWLLIESPYKDLIDPSRIGMAGHSMGGIVTARAGIFDNWTNPKTGNPVGTGGKVRAYCSIYCWDDPRTMAEGLMRRALGIDNIWTHPTIQRLLTQWRWLSNHDPAVVAEELRLRAVAPFINAANIPNFCLVTGRNDELTTMEAQYYIMANATRNAAGAAKVDWATIRDAVDASPEHLWYYGDVAKGTGRRLVIVPDVDHIQEAISRDVMQEVLDWFNVAMACTNIDTFLPAGPWAWQLGYLAKVGGWWLVLMSMLGLLLPIMSYVSTSSRLKWAPQEPSPPEVMDYSKSPLAENRPADMPKRLLKYGIAVTVPFAVAAVIPLPSLTHFWIFDLVVGPLLVAAAILLPLAIVVARKEQRAFNLPLAKIGVERDLAGNARRIALVLAAVGIVLGVINFMWVFQVPIALPRPAEDATWLDFLAFLGILFALNLGAELLFRGLHQSRLMQGEFSFPVKWKIIIKSGLASGTCIGIAATTWVVISFGALFTNIAWVIPLLTVMLIMGLSVAGAVDAWVFLKTRNVLCSAVLNALLAVFFLTGKLILTYA